MLTFAAASINVELLFSRHRLRMGKSTRRKLEREESDEEKERKEQASEESDTSVFTSLSKLPSDPPSTNGTRRTSHSAKQQKEKGKKQTTSHQTPVDIASESESDDTHLSSFSDLPLHPSGGAKKSSNGKTESRPVLVPASDSDSDSDIENLSAFPRYRSRAKVKLTKNLRPPGRAIKGRKRQPSPKRRSNQESSIDSSEVEASVRPARKMTSIPGKGKSIKAVNKLAKALIENSSESDDMEDFSMDVDMDTTQPPDHNRKIPVPSSSLDDENNDLNSLSSSPPASRSSKGKGRASVSSSSDRRLAARKSAASQASSLPDRSPPSRDVASPGSERIADTSSSPLRKQFGNTRISSSRPDGQPFDPPGHQATNSGTSFARTTPNNRRPFDVESQDSYLQHPLNTQDIDRLKTPSLNYSESPPSQLLAAGLPVAGPSRPSSVARKTIPAHLATSNREVVDISSDEEDGGIIEIGSSDDDDEPVLLPSRPTVKMEVTVKKESTAAPKSK